MTNEKDGRELVLDMLLRVIDGDEFGHRVLGRTLSYYQDKDKQERAFISRLFIGTIKHYLTLDYVIEQFSSLPVRKMKPFIRNLLRLSVYQLLYMDKVPASAVCNEAVKLAKKRGFIKLSGFVNANLRNIARAGDIRYPNRDENIVEYLSIRYSTPTWIVDMLLDQYNLASAEAMLEDSLRENEITIRCNRIKTTPDELKEKLIGEGVGKLIEHPYLKDAFVIKDIDYLEGLAAFNDGLFTVQDVSSMLVGEVSGAKCEDFVVDVCAAPGGKALHIAEKAGKVSARDLTEFKTKLIEENILRLGIHNTRTKVWDATTLDPDIINKVDIVIADLPCSGLGVLGKKYDIKYKLTQNQQKELVELQRKILHVVSEYVKPGGVLIYSTCTVNRHENIGNMEWFLANHNFVSDSLNSYLPQVLHSDTTKAGYLQLLQGIHPTDGFFICRMRKESR